MEFIVKLTIIIMFFGGSFLFSQEHECDAVLIQNVVIEAQNSREIAAYMQLITESNYEILKRNLEITIPEIGNLSYQQFDEKRREYFQKTKWNYDKEYSRSLIRRYLSD